VGYVYQEFPKCKYHPKHGSKIVQDSDEEKALGKGWYNNPGQFPKPSRIATLLNEQVRPWWEKWRWAVGAIGAVLAIVAPIVAILRH
jgi:hypothetical protein